MTMTKAELFAHPNYWMLAYSEADKAWLTKHGYPSLEEEAMLSGASMETLQSLVDAGNANAGVHLAARFARNALSTGDARQFFAARREFERALFEGGAYQAAKTIAFFAELANNRKAYGELDADTLKGLETHLLSSYSIARGLSAAYGDYGAEYLGNGPYSQDIGRLFGLPPAKSDIPFEQAMQRFSNINALRVRRGLPPFDLERRPGESSGLGFKPTYTVYAW